MVGVTCWKCGREWDYTGRSDHYCTCPNCKTSVKVGGGSERAKPSETAKRCPDPSDRTAETVQVRAGGREEQEMAIGEAIVALDGSVTELYELEDGRTDAIGETVGELRQTVEERGRSLDDLEQGLEELAGYFKQMMEEMGGEVEYDHIDAGRAIPEALESVDVDEMEEVEA